jgi:hypothetical protein
MGTFARVQLRISPAELSTTGARTSIVSQGALAMIPVHFNV